MLRDLLDRSTPLPSGLSPAYPLSLLSQKHPCSCCLARHFHLVSDEGPHVRQLGAKPHDPQREQTVLGLAQRPQHRHCWVLHTQRQHSRLHCE